MQERNSLSEDAIKARITSQITDEERVGHADVVIQNNGTLEELTQAVEALWAERIEAKVKNNIAWKNNLIRLKADLKRLEKNFVILDVVEA